MRGALSSTEMAEETSYVPLETMIVQPSIAMETAIAGLGVAFSHVS